MHKRPLLNIAAYTYLFVMLGLLFAPLVSRAETFPASQSSNSVTFSSNPYAGDAAVAGAALAISAGVVYASQPATLRTIAGVVAPLVVRAAPVAGAIGSAVLACFGNPACVVATAAAAAYVANELSYGYSTDPVTGVPVVTKTTPDTPGTYYVIGFSIPQVPGTTRLEACQKIYGSGANVSQSGGTWYCYNQFGQGGYGIGELSAPVTGGTAPSTPAALATAIGAKTDWSSDSKITELLEKIVKNTSQTIPLQVPSVTGPTSIVDTPTVQTNADGSKVTTTKTTNFGYYGPTATATETSVVTNTTPAGVTTTTSTTTSAPAIPAKTEITVDVCGLPGKPACIISEVGTPTAPTVTGQAAITDGFTSLENTVTGIQSPTGKDTGWGLVPTWLQSGTSCHPVVLITFPPTLGSKVISLDICPHLDNIYLLMNALWVIWTFTAVVGLVRGSTATGAA
jgi:hypothetical protein